MNQAKNLLCGHSWAFINLGTKYGCSGRKSILRWTKRKALRELRSEARGGRAFMNSRIDLTWRMDVCPPTSVEDSPSRGQITRLFQPSHSDLISLDNSTCVFRAIVGHPVRMTLTVVRLYDRQIMFARACGAFFFTVKKPGQKLR